MSVGLLEIIDEVGECKFLLQCVSFLCLGDSVIDTIYQRRCEERWMEVLSGSSEMFLSIPATGLTMSFNSRICKLELGKILLFGMFHSAYSGMSSLYFTAITQPKA
jgi:hypothetical protein